MHQDAGFNYGTKPYAPLKDMQKIDKTSIIPASLPSYTRSGDTGAAIGSRSSQWGE